MVESYDEHYRALARAEVEALADQGYTEAQAAERIIEDWGGTRHGGDALAVLRQRYRPPQRETPERSRGGPDLGWP